MADFWSTISGGALHTGSWFGLPDFGFTELLTKQRTGERGSDIIPNLPTPGNYQWTPSQNLAMKPDSTPSQFQQALGLEPITNIPEPKTNNPPPSNTSGGGGSNGGGGGSGGGGGGGTPPTVIDLTRGKNVGDVINIGGRNYRVVDPDKGIIEPHWDNTWSDVIQANRAEEERRRAEEEQRRRIEMENRIRGQIESGYNEFIKRLDELAGLYPQWQQEDISRLQTSQQTGLQGLETAKTSGLEKLGLAREQALQQEQQAKGDIMSQLRQLLKASQMKTGLLGAGWSSATQQVLPAILGKQAAQTGAQVARGTISNLNQTAQKEVDVRNTFELAKNELEQDFNTKMDEIAQRYRQLKSWIETEKANASLKKAQALASLDENLMNNFINEANWYKQTYLQQQQALQQWALNRLAQLQDYKIQLGQMSNFSPEQLTYQALQGLGGLTGRESGGWGEDIFGSLVNTAKRKKELLGL